MQGAQGPWRPRGSWASGGFGGGALRAAGVSSTENMRGSRASRWGSGHLGVHLGRDRERVAELAAGEAGLAGGALVWTWRQCRRGGLWETTTESAGPRSEKSRRVCRSPYSC